MKAYLIIKSILDKIFALISIVICFPLLLIVLIAVSLDFRGKPMFRQERVGKNQKSIYIFKFRTMKKVDVAFDKNNPVIEDDNQNLTFVGRIIRKLKIDELPQLFNVLIGDMSFVGPRPLMRTYMSTYAEWEKEKFNAVPGLTGLAQVLGNGNLPTEERSYYDIMYTRKVNFLMDVGIFFRTFLIIIFGEKRYIKRVDSADLQSIKNEK